MGEADTRNNWLDPRLWCGMRTRLTLPKFGISLCANWQDPSPRRRGLAAASGSNPATPNGGECKLQTKEFAGA